MTSRQLRQSFIDFFVKKGHREIPSSPLLPENDPTTLFTSSGMQPLVPYLLGAKHPEGQRLVNSQICFRAEDIDQVGDNRHTTFFEMLGNWSLGDYFKKEQLSYFFEFLTQVVGLDPQKLSATVFAGDKIIPRDEESTKIWQELFKTSQPAQEGSQGFNPKVKIYTYGADKNWWSRSGAPENMPEGEIGGPDSEVFYDFGEDLHQKSPYQNQPCHPNCQCGRFLEIGNSVFMEYQKTQNGFTKLPQRNVDFGGGLERILAAKNNQPDIFITDLFWPLILEIEKNSGKKYSGNEKAVRIIADHLKAATFMIAEGLEPSNKLAGYVLRRLLRRAAVALYQLKGGLTPDPAFTGICHQVLETYQDTYLKNDEETKKKIEFIVNQEMGRFGKSLDRGLKLINKCNPQKIDCRFAFNLFQTYGFPFEIIQELTAAKGCHLSKIEFDQEFARHQALSRTASKGLFKGGLADHSGKITRLHTATHLLHAALRQVLGKHVQQVGSNITQERLRFDFAHPQKLTPSEIEEVQKLVNQTIQENLRVNCQTMSLTAAQKKGALAFFSQRYPQNVTVYSVGSFSCEVCAGPHVDFTGGMGKFMIFKEESAGLDKRRLYARLL